MPGALPAPYVPPQNPDDVMTPPGQPPAPVVQPGAEAPITPPTQANSDITAQLGLTPDAIQSLAPSAGALPAAERKLQEATDAASGAVSQNSEQINAIANQDITHPAAPTLESIPSPPDETPDPHKALRVFGETLPVLAMLGGLFMQRDATGALNAASAAIEAARTNDTAALAAAHQQWQDSVAAINARNETELKQYQAILSDTRMTMDERQSHLQALAASTQNALVLQQLATGNISGIAAGVNTWATAAQTFASAVTAQARANAATGAASTWTPEAIEEIAQGMADGAPAPTNLGRNGIVAGQLYSRVAAIRRERGDTPGALLADRVAFQSYAASLRQTVIQRGAILRAEDAARRNINLAESVLSRLQRQQSPLLNRWVMPGLRNLGDPDIQAASIALDRALDEYARVITGQYGAAGTPVTQLQSAREMLSSADNPATIQRAFAVIRTEMENVRQSFDDQEHEARARLSGQGVRPLSESRRTGDHYFMNDGTVGIWRGDHFEVEADH